MCRSGYHTDQATFSKRVESDASSFRPSGQLIHSYTRLAPSSTSKGKRKRSGNQVIDPDSEEAIEFEAYHVCNFSPIIWSNAQTFLGNLGYAWLSRVSSQNAAVHSSLYRGRVVYQWGGRYLGICRSVGSIYCLIVSCWAFLRFEKRKRRDPSHGVAYHFVGYSSLYPFYYYPEKVRLRLRLVCWIHLPILILMFSSLHSQFVILTPYQRQGHGCKSPRSNSYNDLDSTFH